jgi:hypothetical protein
MKPMKAYEQALSLAETLKLKGVSRSLDEMVNDAESGKVSYISFLNSVFSAEISWRAKRRFERNMAGAHFPMIKRMKSWGQVFYLFRVSEISRTDEKLEFENLTGQRTTASSMSPSDIII